MFNKLKSKMSGPGKGNKNSKKSGLVDGASNMVGVPLGGDATGAGVAPSVAQAVAVNHANKKVRRLSVASPVPHEVTRLTSR